MCVDPEKRATLEEILDHEWIRSDTLMQQKAHAMMEQAMPKDQKRPNSQTEDEQTNNLSFKRLKNSYSDSTDKSN